MIGEKIGPILSELEGALWEFEAQELGPPEFTDEGMRASIKIFMSVLMDKMWNLQEKEGVSSEIRADMALKAGQEVRELFKKYTDLDTHDLYS